jgi:hypothetical protein
MAGAAGATDELKSLPMPPGLTEREQEWVVAALRAARG